MEKLGLVIKKEEERIIKNRLKESDCFFLMKYSGLSASDLNSLRISLSGVDSSLMVVKNSVSKRVLKSQKDLVSLIEGPCSIVFVKEDLIAASRVVYKFKKVNASLEVMAGMLKDRLLSEQELEELSKIPSIAALHAKLVGTLNSPIVGFVFCLKNILNKFAWVISQIKDKKEKGGSDGRK